MMAVPNPESVDAVRPFLDEGEKILWTGRPRRGLVLRASDMFLIPFSLAWGGFAIFWEAMAITMGAPFFFALFGVPFVLVGLQLMVGRFFSDARIRARTHYLITNQRAIVLYSGTKSKLKSWNLNQLGKTEITRASNGSGTLTFGAGDKKTQQGFTIPFSDPDLGPFFEMIPDVKEASDILNEAKRNLPAPEEQSHGSFWDENLNQDEYNINQEEDGTSLS